MPALRSMEERVPAASWVRLSHYELEGPVKRAGDIAAAAFSRGGSNGDRHRVLKGGGVDVSWTGKPIVRGCGFRLCLRELRRVLRMYDIVDFFLRAGRGGSLSWTRVAVGETGRAPPSGEILALAVAQFSGP